MHEALEDIQSFITNFEAPAVILAMVLIVCIIMAVAELVRNA